MATRAGRDALPPARRAAPRPRPRGVSNAIWDRPGPLADADWERVRLHPYFTERALARCAGLAALGRVAAAHHERLDGTGYHRGAGGALPIAARVLAAADAYSAHGRAAPVPAALSADDAAGAMRPRLRAAPSTPRRSRPSWPQPGTALSPRGGLPGRADRARGRGAARLSPAASRTGRSRLRLDISAKTVGHHSTHVYSKLGVSTRAGLALAAMRHGLLDDAGCPRVNAR